MWSAAGNRCSTSKHVYRRSAADVGVPTTIGSTSLLLKFDTSAGSAGAANPSPSMSRQQWPSGASPLPRPLPLFARSSASAVDTVADGMPITEK